MVAAPLWGQGCPQPWAPLPARKQTLHRPECRDILVSVLWFWGRTTPSSRYSQWSVLTAMPSRPRPHMAKTLLSRVRAFLLQAPIFLDNPAGACGHDATSREWALVAGQQVSRQ